MFYSDISDDNNTGNVGKCSADSFMIDDGVCDEATNNAMCLYDGGDCCLESKNKELCRECDCRQTKDKDELFEDFARLDVRQFDRIGDYELVLTKRVKTVEDVVTLDVCSSHCLDLGDDQPVNAWKYNNATRVCECSMVSSDNFCSQSVTLLEVMKNGSEVAYIQKAQLLECGCFKKELSFNSSEFKEVIAIVALTEWECRDDCVNKEDCKLFSWSSNITDENTGN